MWPSGPSAMCNLRLAHLLADNNDSRCLSQSHYKPRGRYPDTRRWTSALWLCRSVVDRDWKRRSADVRSGGRHGGEHVDRRSTWRRYGRQAELLDTRRAHQNDTVPAADRVRVPARSHCQRVAPPSRQSTLGRCPCRWRQYVESQQPPSEGTQSNNGTSDIRDSVNSRRPYLSATHSVDISSCPSVCPSHVCVKCVHCNSYIYYCNFVGVYSRPGWHSILFSKKIGWFQ